MKIVIRLVCFCFLFNASFGISQTQLGSDIDGEAANNSSGWSVSMPNGSVVAIGAPSNDDMGSGAGHVRIFDWNGNGWAQRGADIDGQMASEKVGTDVVMPNSNTVGIGIPGNALSTGRIEIYTWDGNTWVQKGNDIVGLSIGERFGYAISMPNENTVAIGTQGADTYSQNLNGKVLVYEWNGSSWIQKGGQIIGEFSNDKFGYDVSMPNAVTLAVSTPFNDESGVDAGHVRVYDWNGTNWLQRGSDIDGASAGENFGWSICMSDENTLAVGSPKASGNGLYNSGTVKIYNWNGSSWLQKGNTINGENIGEAFGTSLSMPNATTVGSGARYTSESYTNSGSARVYSFDGTSWNKIGSSVNGEAQDDESGFALSMGDANTIAIGSIRNKGNGNDAGHVRIYQLDPSLSLDQLEFNEKLTVFPNPSNGEFNFVAEKLGEYKLFSIQGELVLQGIADEGFNTVRVDFPAGIYLFSCQGSVQRIVIQ